ncbi:class I SAM-dependent methyltransferase [Streptomyces uncialis]|uniref:class I SAM-dependent methyltransferase n=1 Tax=Streptomyces uncialis TaxID=1048205 RepID=UPI0037FAC2F9
MSGDVRQHYERLAATYDDNWAHDPAVIRWMSERIVEALDIRPGDRLADIGSGTGLFARQVDDIVRPLSPLQCVDPSPAMLGRITDAPNLLAIEASAEDLAEGRVLLPHLPLDAAWIKEAVHHIEDRATTLAGLSQLLSPGGRLLIVMLPTTIAYPLFGSAIEMYQALQPDPEDIARHLRAAGLLTRVSHVEHTLTIDRERYLAMVRDRYMSLLAHFDDAEIEAGIEEIRTRHPEPRLTFPDRFAFVLGRRSAAPAVEPRNTVGATP